MPDAANYTFYITCDDGANLWIDDELVLSQATAGQYETRPILLTGSRLYHLQVGWPGRWASQSWSMSSTKSHSNSICHVAIPPVISGFSHGHGFIHSPIWWFPKAHRGRLWGELMDGITWIHMGCQGFIHIHPGGVARLVSGCEDRRWLLWGNMFEPLV